jgi:hypothetical protein
MRFGNYVSFNDFLKHADYATTVSCPLGHAAGRVMCPSGHIACQRWESESRQLSRSTPAHEHCLTSTHRALTHDRAIALMR